MAVWKRVSKDNLQSCVYCKSIENQRYTKRDLVACEKCLSKVFR